MDRISSVCTDRMIRSVYYCMFVLVRFACVYVCVCVCVCVSVIIKKLFSQQKSATVYVFVNIQDVHHWREIYMKKMDLLKAFDDVHFLSKMPHH